MTSIYLSVIVPAYNEADNLKTRNLDKVFLYLQTLKQNFELILVNDGSTDATLKLLEEFALNRPEVKVLNNPHQGKALTVKSGMLVATGQYRLFTDLDQSTPIAEVEKLLPYFKQGYQIIIGSREVAGAKREAEPLHRHLMGKAFNLVVRLLAIPNVKDSQCGFKLFSAKATTDLFNRLIVTIQPKPDAFTGAFDVELLFLGRKSGYRIVEVPVIWHHIKSQRVNPLKDSWRMFSEVVRIRWASLSKQYATKNA